MYEVPAPVLNAVTGAVVAALAALAFWSVRQVRSAARVVSNDATLRQTLADQSALILSQERRIVELERCLAEANLKIDDLTGIIRQMQLVEEIRPAKRISAAPRPTAGG